MSPAPGGESTKALDERFFGVIRALLTTDDTGLDGRLPHRTVALHFSRPGKPYENIEVTLSRYIKRKFRANADSAIALGEALYEAGVPWSTGWWMLYAAGRFDAYVYVTTRAFKALAPYATLADYHAYWEMICSANELCLSTELDGCADVAALHRQHSGPIAKANRIYCSALPAELSSHRSSLHFLRRETAKANYCRIDDFRASLSEAYGQFLQQLTLPDARARYGDIDDRHVLAAMSQASSSQMALPHKEFMIRHHLKLWLESVASKRSGLVLPEYELNPILEESGWDGLPVFAIDISDMRLAEALGRVSGLSWYDERDAADLLRPTEPQSLDGGDFPTIVQKRP